MEEYISDGIQKKEPVEIENISLRENNEQAELENNFESAVQDKADYILKSAKRIKNFDMLMKARDSEQQGKVLWGTIKTVVLNALWKPREVGFEEAVIEVETEEGLTIHVNQRQAPIHMPTKENLVFMTGEKVPVVVVDHIRIEGTKKSWDEVNYRANSDYVLLGSIKQAEWSLGKQFEVLYNREDSPLKRELRGDVTSIFEPFGAAGYRFLNVSYNGVNITIPADAFSYVSRSRVQRLEDIVKVGQEVYFKVFALEQQPVTPEMVERHGVMGDETYWSIVGEALYDKEEPHAAISRLKQSGALATQAYLVSETMDGYFVELVDAPGIVLRMRVLGRSNKVPTHEMFERHEKVAVRLSTLKETYRIAEDGRTLYDGYVSYLPQK